MIRRNLYVSAVERVLAGRGRRKDEEGGNGKRPPAPPCPSLETGKGRSGADALPTLDMARCLEEEFQEYENSHAAHLDFSGIGIGRRLLFARLRGVRGGARTEHPRYSHRQRDRHKLLLDFLGPLRGFGSGATHPMRAMRYGGFPRQATLRGLCRDAVRLSMLAEMRRTLPPSWSITCSKPDGAGWHCT